MECVVVGGVSAVLHGAPLATFDVDVVHQRSPANVERLLAALRELDAFFREKHEKRLRPTPEQLDLDGTLLLETRHGDLDILGTVGHGLRYEHLLDRSSEVPIGEGLTVRVLDLEALIELKAELDREKDRLQVLILKSVLEERRRKDS